MVFVKNVNCQTKVISYNQTDVKLVPAALIHVKLVPKVTFKVNQIQMSVF
jgi:hypothetical protein